MDKYGVQIDEQTSKIAEETKGGKVRCPRCGTIFDSKGSNVPKCPQCGTEPFERGSSR